MLNKLQHLSAKLGILLLTRTTPGNYHNGPRLTQLFFVQPEHISHNTFDSVAPDRTGDLAAHRQSEA